jgi:hypothetical protein
MTTLDKILVSIDRRPFDCVVRMLIGFFFIPLLSRLHQDIRSGWVLTIGLILVMLSMRLLPAVARKLLPLSPAIKDIWAERRNISKRFDSFQWQKLLFIGIGLASYILVSREFLTSILGISGFCVLFGAIGWLRWRTQVDRVRNGTVNKLVV